MKLDYDCVRDCLFAIEKLSFVQPGSFNFIPFSWRDIFNECSQYKDNEIFYTVYQLSKAEYIRTDLEDISVPSEMIIFNLTFKGHELLDSIRDKNIWDKVKSTLKYMTFELILHTAKHFVVNQSVKLPPIP